jgi:hypothetical protein
MSHRRCNPVFLTGRDAAQFGSNATYRWHRRQLPRLAFFNCDEAMVEFTRRAGGPKTLEDRNIFDMMIRRSFGEITLELSDEQYAKLKRLR